jgi:hypothetical protein
VIRKKVSRRIAQRRSKRAKKTKILEQLRPLLQRAYHTKQHCLKAYGFQANPGYTLQKNFNLTMQEHCKNPSPLYQPTNLTFHNLCKNIKLPTGTKALLGFNLKYCLSNNTINQDINKTLLKMAYSIRTKYQLKAIGHTSNHKFTLEIKIGTQTQRP